MEAIESVRVKWDAVTGRVEVTYGDRRIRIPGKHSTLEDAKAAAETYAHRYLHIK